MNRKVLVVLGMAFLVNGCALDNLRKFSFFHKKAVVGKAEKVVKKENNTTAKVAKMSKITKKKKSIQNNSNVKKVNTVKSKTIHKIHKSKPKKLKPEPFSIKSHKEDPELLGPQTTLKANPIT